MLRRELPNLITWLRIILVPFFWFSLRERQFSVALGLFIIAGISDGLDGLLAKRYGWTSRFGSILDPLADKLLLVTAFISLTQIGLLPIWLSAAVLGRDVVIVVGAIAYHFVIGKYRMSPLIIGKLNTFMQIALVIAVILAADSGAKYLSPRIITGLIYFTLATTILSGANYILLWGWRALRESN